MHMPTTPIALHHAWRLARQHNHHWGVHVTPERLSFGRRILCEFPWLRQCESFNSDGYRSAVDAVGSECLHREPWQTIDNGEVTGDPDGLEYPPATHQDALALSALPTCLGWGRSVPEPDADGAYSDWTGSRRLHWTCRTDGSISLEIERPVPGRVPGSDAGYAVLRADVSLDDGVYHTTVQILAECRWDHMRALLDAIGAVTLGKANLVFDPEAAAAAAKPPAPERRLTATIGELLAEYFEPRGAGRQKAL